MTSLDQELRAIAARGISATVTPDGLLTSVTARAARRRATAVAGAGLSALAAMGLAATAAISLGRHEPPATPPDKVLGTVTLPFDSTSAPSGERGSAGLACGDPAPTPVTRSAGLDWDTTAPPRELGFGVGVSTTLRNMTGDTLPASVSPLFFVIVHDDVVAGWTVVDPSLTGWDYRYLDSGPENRLRGMFLPDGVVCPGQGLDGALAPGDYLAYPVIQVSASPKAAARQWLRLEGYSVPTDNVAELAILTPGSWDCETLLQPSGWPDTSALCAPATLTGVTLDRDAQTIGLPYTARLYERSLDATLVGEPYTYTAPSPGAGASFLGFDETPFQPVDTSALSCGAHVDRGANFATGRTSGALERTALETKALETKARMPAESGTALRLAALPRVSSTLATVAYPEPVRVWFLADEPTSPDDLGKVRGPGYTVLGSGSAVVNGGSAVSLDRFAGPSMLTVVIADAQWCLGSEAQAVTAIAYEGSERAVLTNGSSTDSMVFDFWSADFFDWVYLVGTR